MIQNLDHFTYKHGKDLWITEAARKELVEVLKNEYSAEKKAAFLNLLDTNSAECMAKMEHLKIQPQVQSEALPQEEPEAMPQEEPEAMSQEEPEAMPRDDEEAMRAYYKETTEHLHELREVKILKTEILDIEKQQMEMNTKGKKEQFDIEIQGKKDLREENKKDLEVEREAIDIKKSRMEVDRQAAKEADERLQRQNDMKLKSEQALFEQRRQHEAILYADKRKRTLDVQREDQEKKKQKVVSSSQQADDNLITVGEVARENTNLFKDIKKEHHADVSKKAGGYCFNAYCPAKGKAPKKISRGKYDVALYNPGEDKAKFIIPALEKAVKEHIAKANGLKTMQHFLLRIPNAISTQ